jgi:hypothetical protein
MSATQLFATALRAKRASGRLGLGRHWGGRRDQLCQSSEVLGGGGEKELVVSAVRASQPEPVQAQMRFRCANSISIFLRSRRDVT